jgi:hypothetical protein
VCLRVFGFPSTACLTQGGMTSLEPVLFPGRLLACILNIGGDELGLTRLSDLCWTGRGIPNTRLFAGGRLPVAMINPFKDAYKLHFLNQKFRI